MIRVPSLLGGLVACLVGVALFYRDVLPMMQFLRLLRTDGEAVGVGSNEGPVKLDGEVVEATGPLVESRFTGCECVACESVVQTRVETTFGDQDTTDRRTSFLLEAGRDRYEIDPDAAEFFFEEEVIYKGKYENMPADYQPEIPSSIPESIDDPTIRLVERVLEVGEPAVVVGGTEQQPVDRMDVRSRIVKGAAPELMLSDTAEGTTTKRLLKESLREGAGAMFMIVIGLLIFVYGTGAVL